MFSGDMMERCNGRLTRITRLEGVVDAVPTRQPYVQVCWLEGPGVLKVAATGEQPRVFKSHDPETAPLAGHFGGPLHALSMKRRDVTAARSTF